MPSQNSSTHPIAATPPIFPPTQTRPNLSQPASSHPFPPKRTHFRIAGISKRSHSAPRHATKTHTAQHFPPVFTSRTQAPPRPAVPLVDLDRLSTISPSFRMENQPMEEATHITGSQRQFRCKNCGADLVFAPGTESLVCPHCGTENQIPKVATDQVQEEDFRATLASLADNAQLQDALTVKCISCGAESQFGGDVVSNKCPFCGAPIVATAESKKQIRAKPAK